jgi:phospholipid N-methyltransferase
MNQQLIESLKKCIVQDANTIALPTERLNNYPEVRKALINAGGKYKKNTFLFNGNAEEIFCRLTEGEKVNDKNKFQMFFTPSHIAKKIVHMSEIFLSNPYDCHILEPSAGQGAIIEEILKVHPNANIYAIEINKQNCKVLNEKFEQSPNIYIREADFLKTNIMGDFHYSHIIANPPFTKNQDIDHIMFMWDKLKPGGTLVSISSTHWTFANEKKCKDFRDFLENSPQIEYKEVVPIEAGEFKESGTNIKTIILKIIKSSAK